MKKFYLLIIIAILTMCAVPCEAGGRRGQPPAPRILEPGDDTNLAGKEELEFRWSSEGDRSMIDFFDFRVYKGTQTIESGLIHAEKVSTGKHSVKLKASLFEDGQTYAWSIRSVGRQKSRSNYALFKINKQPQ